MLSLADSTLSNFDGPIIHLFMKMNGKASANTLYDKAMVIIKAQDDDKFAHQIYPNDRDFKWCCLFKINHYDNRAKTTSLKALEFAMRMDNISDLPFPIGTVLNQEQIEVLKRYCEHDVRATELFRTKNIAAIQFREELTKKHGKDFMNHNDTKIGSEIFTMELEKAGVQLYEYGTFGRQMKQTKRTSMCLGDAILPWIQLETPGFKRILDWLRHQTITETKGVFTDLSVYEYGLDFVFGTGGLHAAVENEVIVARDDMLIESRDVSSYYPNLAIKNNFYPEHLGQTFCTIYESLYQMRKNVGKKTTEGAALKLALNGTYGKSGDAYSVFYDVLFLLKITLNGQLLLCLLVENLMKIPTVQIKTVTVQMVSNTLFTLTMLNQPTKYATGGRTLPSWNSRCSVLETVCA